MDFAALMSSQISKAKNDGSGRANKNGKYAKRSDLEAARREEYAAKQRKLEAEREAKRAAKRRRDEEAAEETRAREEKRRKIADAMIKRRAERERDDERARRKRLGLPDLEEDEEKARLGSFREGSHEIPGADDDDDDDDRVVIEDDADLTRRLREMGEPAVLFGETTFRARLRRYRRLCVKTTEGPIPTTLKLVQERDMKVDGTVPQDTQGKKYLFRQLASYFTMILKEWAIALECERRDTVASREACNAMVQSREHMKPLFRKFEKGELEESILEPIVEVVKAAQEKRYVDATDGFLRLSIGKAAWPIGVTMVGIHERSAREKLHSGERGHVMGDEVTRKYLQSIKRCLTFAQVRWPPQDLSQLMG